LCGRVPEKRYPNRLEAARLKQHASNLEAVAGTEPRQHVARYGLAMEYVKAGELEAAVAEFKAVAEADPAYSAAYFQGGQTLEKLDGSATPVDFTARDCSTRDEPRAHGNASGAGFVGSG